MQALLHVHKVLGLFVAGDEQGRYQFRPMSVAGAAAAGRCLRFAELPKGLAQPSIYQRYWVRYAVLGAASLWGSLFLFRCSILAVRHHLDGISSPCSVWHEYLWQR